MNEIDMSKYFVLPDSLRNFDRRGYRRLEMDKWDEVKCRKELNKLHYIKRDLYKDKDICEIKFVKELINYIYIIQNDIRKRIERFEREGIKFGNKELKKIEKWSDEQVLEYINKVDLLNNFGKGKNNGDRKN